MGRHRHPALDQTGYQSPRVPSQMQRHQAQQRQQREQRREARRVARDMATEANRQATRERNPERRGEPVPAQPQPAPRPPAVLSGDQLPGDQAMAIMRDAPGRTLGWYAVTFGGPDGPQWVPVDQSGPNGPRVTAAAGGIVPFRNGSNYEPGMGPVGPIWPHKQKRASAPRDSAAETSSVPTTPRRPWWRRWWQRRGSEDPPTSPGTRIW